MAKGQVVRIGAFASLAEDMEAAVKGFISYCRAKNLSENTIIYYSYRLEAFKEYIETNAPGTAPKNVTPTLIREFVADQSRKHSASTANHAIITLKAFFNYLVRDGFLETSPASSAERLRRKRTIIDTFSTGQVEAILKTCNKDFPGLRDKAVLLVLFDCGLRASELCGLRLDDVDWKGQTLKVMGKGSRERLVSFGRATHIALSQYVARRPELDNEFVFVTCYGTPLNRFRLDEIVKSRCRKAEITGVRCSPHIFRHTFALSYLRNGGDVFSLHKILGHSDLTMTRRYAELSETDALERHRAYSPGDRLVTTKPRAGRRKIV